jgi:tetraacyldisaccharide 4'-kinase
LIYGLITGIRNFLFDANIISSAEFNIPVICVGNITVGGTGKTPHTEYLISILRDYRVATLSRGYKRKSSGFLVASGASVVEDVGDEPLQIYKKFPDITVAVDNKRVNGVKRILSEKPETGVIILDDGFQHRRIKPGFSILLSDFERFMMKDHLLPYGDLRESLDNIRRADVIIITKSPENISPIERRLIVKDIEKAPYQNLYFTSLKYNHPVSLFTAPVPESFSDDLQKKQTSILLVTGIANPLPLQEYVQKNYGDVTHINFRDHHKFTEEDLQQIFSTWDSIKSPLKYIFTTEKDAVRIQEFTNIAEPYRSSFFYIPIGIFFLNGDQEEFDNLIVDYVRKNKRNNRVSEI